MIIKYYRPDNITEALGYLAETEITTVPLGGGSVLNQPSSARLSVVDLQALGLNKLSAKGKILEIGATVTLQELLDSEIGYPCQTTLHHEANYNIRQVATIAGTIVASDGRSPFVTALLALDAVLNILPSDENVSLGDYLPVRVERSPNHLIKAISVPNNVEFAYEYVARTPADLPVVCAAVAQWPSGRTRVALGGIGDAPVLAMDGPEISGAELAAVNAYREAGDMWASAEYRSDVAGILVRRCIEGIANSGIKNRLENI